MSKTGDRDGLAFQEFHARRRALWSCLLDAARTEPHLAEKIVESLHGRFRSGRAVGERPTPDDVGRWTLDEALRADAYGALSGVIVRSLSAAQREHRRRWRAMLESRDGLLERHLGLVHLQLRRAKPPESMREDLRQEGVLALMRAMESFDPTLGTRFSTYAIYWIRSSMSRARRRLEHPCRVPDHVEAKRRRYERALREAAVTETADASQAASAAGLSEAQVRTVESYRACIVQSVDELAGHAAVVPDLDQAIDMRRHGARMPDLLGQLTPRERLIVRRRFQLDDGGGITFHALGDELGLSRERVRQIQHRALSKLRFALEAPAMSSTPLAANDFSPKLAAAAE